MFPNGFVIEREAFRVAKFLLTEGKAQDWEIEERTVKQGSGPV